MPFITWNLVFQDITEKEASKLSALGLIYQPEPEEYPSMYYPEDQPEEGAHEPQAWDRAMEALDNLRKGEA